MDYDCLTYYSAFSASMKFGARIQYPTLVIDPRRSFKCICPHRLHTLPDLSDSGAALSNPYPNACMPST